MPLICNVNAVITCPHQTAVAKPAPNGATAKFAGQTVVNANG